MYLLKKSLRIASNKHSNRYATSVLHHCHGKRPTLHTAQCGVLALSSPSSNVVHYEAVQNSPKEFTGPFLATMGIFCTTSQALIFAPCWYSSFSKANTWVQQGLHFLLAHLSYKDKVGILLEINMDTLLPIIGLADPPLINSLSHTSTLAPISSVTALWQFPNDLQGTLKFNNP